jgi:prophage tail gpP-like protein
MTELIINTKSFKFFSNYTVNLKHNTVASTFQFAGVYDFLAPYLTYSRCNVVRNGETLLTGVIVNESRLKNAKPQLLTCSGYSLPGVLEDCNIPLSLYPLQSDNRNLFEIISRLVQPFGIGVVKQGAEIETALNKQYEKTTAEPTDTVKGYINSLCSQRGIILTHDSKGRLVLKKGQNLPVAKKINNLISFTLETNGQGLHSQISVIKQASTNNPDAGEATVYNSLVRAYRPKVKILNNGDLFDVETAAKNELKAEMATILMGFESIDFFKPGEVIELEIEKVNIKNWFIEEVIISGSSKGERYAYKCVPASVYSN